jgi:hypothetical protein
MTSLFGEVACKLPPPTATFILHLPTVVSGLRVRLQYAFDVEETACWLLLALTLSYIFLAPLFARVLRESPLKRPVPRNVYILCLLLILTILALSPLLVE